MSLPILNEHQAISPSYRRLLACTWGPARVATAAAQIHGPDVLAPLYEAMARQIFGSPDHYRVIRENLDAVIVDALAQVSLRARLANAAATNAYDDALRASHDAAMAPMGGGVGTPIIHLGTGAFFGPVMTAVPSGPEALRVFEGLCLLASYPRLFEIKRPLAGSLDLTAAEPEWCPPRSGTHGTRTAIDTARSA
jgi:hypothetical protein